MQVIPTLPVASQTLNVQLGGQNCQINIYQLVTGLFVDLYVNNLLVIGGVLAEDQNRIVRDLYLGFIGDLCFTDSNGSNDPDFTGLGGRFQLQYLETSDLPAGQG